MEDIFKVFLYGAAILIWIVYKYYEQKKSGIWAPRTNQPPVTSPPVQVPVVLKRQVIEKPALQKQSPRTKQTVSVKKKESGGEEGSMELYGTSLFSPPLIQEEGNERMTFTQDLNKEQSYVLDIRQAIISSEILKRPVW